MDVDDSFFAEKCADEDLEQLELRFIEFIDRIICLPCFGKQRRSSFRHPKATARRLKAVYTRLPPSLRLLHQEALCQVVRLMLTDLEPSGGKMGRHGWVRPSTDWLVNVNNFLRVVLKLVLRIRRDMQPRQSCVSSAQTKPLMGLIQELESVHV